MDDSGFLRTPDRSVKLLGTCVRYLRSDETSMGARGPDSLGGSATGKRLFAECFLSDTRQTLCRELKPTLGEKSNATARRRSWRLCRVSTPRHSANLHPLQSAKSQTLGKASLFYRVSTSRHLAKRPPLPSVNSQTLGKDYSFCRVSLSPALDKVSFFAECQL